MSVKPRNPGVGGHGGDVIGAWGSEPGKTGNDEGFLRGI